MRALPHLVSMVYKNNNSHNKVQHNWTHQGQVSHQQNATMYTRLATTMECTVMIQRWWRMNRRGMWIMIPFAAGFQLTPQLISVCLLCEEMDVLTIYWWPMGTVVRPGPVWRWASHISWKGCLSITEWTLSVDTRGLYYYFGVPIQESTPPPPEVLADVLTPRPPDSGNTLFSTINQKYFLL